MSVELTIPKSEMRKMRKAVDLFQVKQLRKTKNSLQAAALRFETAAKLKTPVGTPESTGIKGYHGGTLRAANKTETTDRGFAIEMRNDTEYAGFVNFGTSRMKGRPFFTKAFEAAVRFFKFKMKS